MDNTRKRSPVAFIYEGFITVSVASFILLIWFVTAEFMDWSHLLPAFWTDP